MTGAAIDGIIRRYQRLVYLANVAILVAALSLLWLYARFFTGPFTGFLLVAVGCALLVRFARVDGSGELVTDKPPETVRSEFLGPKPPTMVLTWARASEVTETDSGYEYTVSPFVRTHVARSEVAETADGIEITMTYDGRPYATQTLAVRRDGDRTVVSVSVATKKLRATEYLLAALQDSYARKAMARMGYEQRSAAT